MLGLAYLVVYLALAAAAAGAFLLNPALKSPELGPMTLYLASLIGFVASTLGFAVFLRTNPRFNSEGGFTLIGGFFKPLFILHGGLALGLLSRNAVVGLLSCVGLAMMVHVGQELLLTRSGVTPPSTLLRREGQAVANWSSAAREGGGGERVDIYCAHPRLGTVPPPAEARRRLWDVYRDADALVLGLGVREILAVSPDGRWMLSTGAGKVFLQNMITNARLVMTGTSAAPAAGASFYVNRDAGGAGSSAVLLVRADGATEEWQVSTGSGARRNPLIQGGSLARAFPSPSGDWVAVVDGAGNFLVIYRSGQATRPFPRAAGEARVTAVAVSPDGETLAVATARKRDEASQEEKGGILELARADGREAPRRLEGRYGLILAAVFNPSGSAVAFISNRGVVYAWVLAEASARRLAEGLDGERGVAFVDDGTVGAFQSGRPVMLPLEQRVETQSADDDEDDDGPIVVAEAFKWKGGPARRYPTSAMPMFAGGGRLVLAESEGSASIWDPREGKQVETREGHRGPIGYLTWDIADKTLYSVSALQASRLAVIDAWDVRSRQAGMLASTAVIHPDSRIVPTADWYQTILLSATGVTCAWYAGASLHVVELGEPGLRSLENEHRGPITGVALSPDGQEAAVGHDDGLVRIWELGDMHVVRTWKAHPGAIDDVKYSADGKFIATLSSAEGVAVWEAHTAKRVWAAGGRRGARGSGLTTLAIAPKGDRVAVASKDGSVDLWTLKDNQVAHLSGLKAAPWALVFGARADVLGGADQDGHIGMWDTRSGTWLGEVGFKVTGASSLAVRSEPRLLAVGDITGTVRVWGPK